MTSDFNESELALTEEEIRLEEDHQRKKNWKRWGPYLSERQWATVREDYSALGDSWNYFPHDHARSRVYRWGEDGLLGFTDRECRLCFALALWNGKDPILKERLYGLTEKEGNHGEDVKECYYYLDSTPSHSYMRALYKYPQKEYPYDHLLRENLKRGTHSPEFELLDTGIFNKNEYFDVYVEYAKNSPNDLLIRVRIVNQSDKSAPLDFLPTLFFRNTWSWGCESEGCFVKPHLFLNAEGLVECRHESLGRFYFALDEQHEKKVPVLFTDNHTNRLRLFGVENDVPFVRDAFHEYIVKGKKEAINPGLIGTKCAPHYHVHFEPKETKEFCFRLFSEEEKPSHPFGASFQEIFSKRKREADLFYQKKISSDLSDEEQLISRQAYAGLLWTKQFYHYVVNEWLVGDPMQPPPPIERQYFARNQEWKHLFARDVISMPDKWEYPWFAAWDLAFHMIPFSKIDPFYAKQQMLLFTREWYMHPNGQLPAYEFSFSDVNPPFMRGRLGGSIK